MGQTARLSLPYPEVTDPPDGANQVEALAVALDGAVQAGTVSLSISSAVTGTVGITFPRPFKVPPVVVVASSNSYWTLSVSSITASGCSVGARDIRGSASNASLTIQWQAVGQPS